MALNRASAKEVLRKLVDAWIGLKGTATASTTTSTPKATTAAAAVSNTKDKENATTKAAYTPMTGEKAAPTPTSTSRTITNKPELRGLWEPPPLNIKSSPWAAGSEKQPDNPPWPDRDERKYFGEKRAEHGMQRFLPPPRTLEIDGKEIAHLVNQGVDLDKASSFMSMDPMEVPWELRRVKPQYRFTKEMNDLLVREYEERKLRAAARLKREMERERRKVEAANLSVDVLLLLDADADADVEVKVEAEAEVEVKVGNEIEMEGDDENGNVPPDGGWRFHEKKLGETGVWSAVLDAIGRTG
jgi:hypothetical protein